MTVVSLLAAACGGGDSNNNNNNNGAVRNFNYGAPAAPTNPQKSTATTAQSQLNGVVTATSTGQVINAAGAPQMTDVLAASLPALVAIPDPTEARANPEDGPTAALRRSPALSGNCITVTATAINYINCSLSSTGYTITLNGNLTGLGNTVTWNLTETIAYSLSGYVLNGTAPWTGNLTATETTITGLGRSAYHYTGSYQNITYSYDYTAAMDLNLTFQRNPFCITGGTLEIRRVLNSTTNGSATPVHDSALKYTWTACNTYTVATGT